jgi:hypothetical protein
VRWMKSATAAASSGWYMTSRYPTSYQPASVPSTYAAGLPRWSAEYVAHPVDQIGSLTQVGRQVPLEGWIGKGSRRCHQSKEEVRVRPVRNDRRNGFRTRLRRRHGQSVDARCAEPRLARACLEWSSTGTSPSAISNGVPQRDRLPGLKSPLALTSRRWLAAGES